MGIDISGLDYAFKGLADGLNQGLLTYQNQKNIQYQRKMEGLMSGAEMDQHGNPTGNFAPWKQAQVQNQGMLQQQQLQNAQTQGQLGAAQLGTYQRENNPNNDLGLSESYRKSGINLPSDLTYKEADEVGEKQVIAKLRAQLAMQNKNMVTPKDWKTMGDDLDPTKNRQGTYGDAQKLLNSTDRLDKIFQQFPDGNIPGPQMSELASATAALYGGGSPQSQHQIDSIIPHSLVGDVKGIESYFANMPVGKEQQAYVKIMQETSNREKQFAQEIMHKNAGAKLGKYEAEWGQDPQHFYRIARDRGILPTEIDSYGHFVPQQQQQTGLMAPGQQAAPQKTASPAKIKKYMSDNDLTEQQAKTILGKNGYVFTQ